MNIVWLVVISLSIVLAAINGRVDAFTESHV